MTPWNAHGMMRMAEQYNKEFFEVEEETEEEDLEDEGDE